jgi:hypothetical protein
MAPPTPDQVTVAIEALRTEAGVWDTQAESMANIKSKTEGLRLSRVEAGLFQVIFDTYEQVIDQVTARAGEGNKEMLDIGTTLRAVADTYEQEEADKVHKLRNIY